MAGVGRPTGSFANGSGSYRAASRFTPPPKRSGYPTGSTAERHRHPPLLSGGVRPKVPPVPLFAESIDEAGASVQVVPVRTPPQQRDPLAVRTGMLVRSVLDAGRGHGSAGFGKLRDTNRALLPGYTVGRPPAAVVPVPVDDQWGTVAVDFRPPDPYPATVLLQALPTEQRHPYRPVQPLSVDRCRHGVIRYTVRHLVRKARSLT